MDREALAEARRRHFEQSTPFVKEERGPTLPSLLIKNIGEFFTGDIARPQAQVGSLLIRDGRIAAFDPADPVSADRVLDAGASRRPDNASMAQTSSGGQPAWNRSDVAAADRQHQSRTQAHC